MKKRKGSPGFVLMMVLVFIFGYTISAAAAGGGFDEARPDILSEPGPQEGEMVDTGPQAEPESFFGAIGQERFDDDVWWERVDVLAGALSVGVLILIILGTILLVKNSRQKRKEASEEEHE